MTVIKRGYGRYFSTLAHREYDSREAAEHYDAIGAQMVAAKREKGAAVLEEIGTDRLPEVIAALEAGSEEILSRTSGELAIRRVLKRYPAYFDPDGADATPQSATNKAKVRGWLEAKGLPEGQPPTEQQLDEAIRNLLSRGSLYLKPGVPEPEQVTDEDIDALSTEEILRRARGWE